MEFISAAWKLVSPSTINNCFRKAGALLEETAAEVDDDDDDDSDCEVVLVMSWLYWRVQISILLYILMIIWPCVGNYRMRLLLMCPNNAMMMKVDQLQVIVMAT